MSAWIYGDAPLAETLGRIAAAGYDGVEIPGEPGRWRPADLRRWLGDHGLAPVALTASCMVETERDLAHPDPRIRAVAVDYVRGCLEFAASIGAPLVQMLASGEPRLAPITSREAEWAWSVAGMQAAARDAERTGVRIAVEPLNRYEGYLVTSAAEALAYLGAVGCRLGSAWRSTSFTPTSRSPTSPASIGAAGSRLWHVQVADTTRRGLGHGHLDLGPIVDALAGINYGGALVVEIMAPGPDPFRAIKDERSAGILDGDIQESLRRLRARWPPRKSSG